MLTRDTPAASDAFRGRVSTGTGGRRRSPPARDISQSVPGTVNGKWSHRDQLVVTTLGRNPYLPGCVDSAVSDDNAYPRRSAALRAPAWSVDHAPPSASGWVAQTQQPQCRCPGCLRCYRLSSRARRSARLAALVAQRASTRQSSACRSRLEAGPVRLRTAGAYWHWVLTRS